MSLLIRNEAGVVIMDSDLQQAKLIHSGTINAPGGTTVFTYPSSVANPILFARQQNLNQSFYVGRSEPQSFSYGTNVAGLVDYRVYSASQNAQSNDAYGLRVKDASGNPVFDSAFSSPDIRQRTLILAAGNQAGQGITTSATVNFTALDGGRPFVLCNPFSLEGFQQNGAQTILFFAIAFAWTSATQIAISRPALFQALGAGQSIIGYRPRYTYFVR